MPSHSVAERLELAEALSAAGPDAPTLCAGWTTRDLAAHLVVRERRPDTGPGMMLSSVGVLAAWSQRVQDQYAQREYAQLVHQIRTGPPRLSWAAIPGVDARVNLLEHLVHCEDVRRAQLDWEARPLPPERQRAIWSALRTAAKMGLRRSPVPVTLATPEGLSEKVADGSGDRPDGRGVTVTGDPAELALYCFGRRDHALVELNGPGEAVAAFRELDLKF